jgi:hypothetical protein
MFTITSQLVSEVGLLGWVVGQSDVLENINKEVYGVDSEIQGT